MAKRRELEKIFCAKAEKWIYHNMKFTFGWEAKVPTKGRFYYSEKSFQKEMRSLIICGRHFIYKFSDIARMGTPMDGVSIAGAPGYVFIQYHERGVKNFYIVEISDIVKEIKAGSKSLTEKRAKEISYKIGILKN